MSAGLYYSLVEDGDVDRKLDSKPSFKRSSSGNNKDESQVLWMKLKYELIDLSPDARPLYLVSLYQQEEWGSAWEFTEATIEYSSQSCSGLISLPSSLLGQIYLPSFV
ncbi:hypothetical protein L3X38_009278 [Prunus dulcis]|uniref:Uncharacterized protein n=1 Tax=Prunus dulcis TaxID=3755 RepID=A0AAD4ZYJ2_PRUDU|nr:hypothetical protein L3X38_009278 [Prunus dulcis]